jgi:hypothetical protein
MRFVTSALAALGLLVLLPAAAEAGNDGCPRIRSASLVIVIPEGGCGAPPPAIDRVTVIRAGVAARDQAADAEGPAGYVTAATPAATVPPPAGDTIIAIGVFEDGVKSRHMRRQSGIAAGGYSARGSSPSPGYSSSARRNYR